MQNVSEILLGRHGVEGVQALLAGAPAQEALRNALELMLEEAGRPDACRLQRAKYKPGRKLTAYYDLTVHPHGDTGSYTRPVAVTWSLREDAVPGWEMEIQVSPLDPRYPQLARLCDPGYVRNLLATYTPPAADHYAISAIRYRPGQRHVLRYSPLNAGAAGDGTGTMFAKLYAGESRRHLCTVIQGVADRLAACMPGVTALRPAAYIAEETTILYPSVDGLPLSQLQLRPTRNLAHYLSQTGAALRAMHAAPATVTQGLQTQDFAAEIKAVAKTCEHIQVLLPPVWHTIHTLLERAGGSYETLPQEAPTFIHGDFKADHVLVPPESRQDAGAPLTLIDFDSCLMADPAFDIGKFLADLHWAYAKSESRDLAQARSAFLAGYDLAPTHPRLLRARIVEAVILVKITAHRVRLFDPNWAATTTAMIERAAAILEQTR